MPQIKDMTVSISEDHSLVISIRNGRPVLESHSGAHQKYMPLPHVLHAWVLAEGISRDKAWFNGYKVGYEYDFWPPSTSSSCC